MERNWKKFGKRLLASRPLESRNVGKCWLALSNPPDGINLADLQLVVFGGKRQRVCSRHVWSLRSNNRPLPDIRRAKVCLDSCSMLAAEELNV